MHGGLASINTFEKCLVGQCAPTLAGLKAGSLFYYAPAPDENVGAAAAYWNGRLGIKGVAVNLVHTQSGGALIYVFRPAMLAELLARGDVKRFLNGRGFTDVNNPYACVAQLKSRFIGDSSFPHEIGLFLGYPLHDVEGFITHQGRDFSLCGLWKVYDNPSLAEVLFARYAKCLAVYKAMFENGTDILKLTVALRRPEYVYN